MFLFSEGILDNRKVIYCFIFVNQALVLSIEIINLHSLFDSKCASALQD